MSAMPLYGFCAAALIGLGVYGVIAQADLLRRIVALNILGGGVFLLFGVIARHAGGGVLLADAVPQALIITGIVVAFSATALAVMLLARLGQVPETDDPETDGGA